MAEKTKGSKSQGKTTGKQNRGKTDEVKKLFKQSIYYKLDQNNLKLILSVQHACLDVVKVCATTIKAIQKQLKRHDYEQGCKVRGELLGELNEASTMLKRTVDTFKGVQPDANKDLSEAMLRELTRIREEMEVAQNSIYDAG